LDGVAGGKQQGPLLLLTTAMRVTLI